MPPSELKRDSRVLMRENAPKIFIISVIYVAIVTLMAELQFRLPNPYAASDSYLSDLAAGKLPGIGTIISYFRFSGLVLALVLWLFLPVVEIGLYSYCIKLTRGKEGDYKDLLEGFHFFFKAVLIRVITSVLTLLWSLLLLFPGIAAHYRYRLAFYVLLDNPDMGALQCIRESKRIMHGNKLDLFLLDLSFIGWIILDAFVIVLLPLPFSLPLVSIWLTPYQGLANAAYYNRLIKTIAV